MKTSHNNISDNEKEAIMFRTIQEMLQKYADENGVTVDVIYYDFYLSRTYHSLYDFDNGLWSKGSDFLLEAYKQELEKEVALYREQM